MFTVRLTFRTTDFKIIRVDLLFVIIKKLFSPFLDLDIKPFSIPTNSVENLPTIVFTVLQENHVAGFFTNKTFFLVMFLCLTFFLFILVVAYLTNFLWFIYQVFFVNYLTKLVKVSFLEFFSFTKKNEKTVLANKTRFLFLFTVLTTLAEEILFNRLFNSQALHVHSLSTFCAINHRIVARSLTWKTNYTIRFHNMIML